MESLNTITLNINHTQPSSYHNTRQYQEHRPPHLQSTILASIPLPTMATMLYSTPDASHPYTHCLLNFPSNTLK